MGHEQETRLKSSRMHIYVRRGGPNYQTGLARMRALGDELGVPLEVTKHTYGVLLGRILIFIRIDGCRYMDQKQR